MVFIAPNIVPDHFASEAKSTAYPVLSLPSSKVESSAAGNPFEESDLRSCLHALNNFKLLIFPTKRQQLRLLAENSRVYIQGETHEEAFKRETIERPGEISEEELRKYSSLFLSRTPIDFLQDVELAIRLTNTPQQVLLDLESCSVQDWDDEKIEKFIAIAKPVYAMLSNWGYNHADLTE